MLVDRRGLLGARMAEITAARSGSRKSTASLVHTFPGSCAVRFQKSWKTLYKQETCLFFQEFTGYPSLTSWSRQDVMCTDSVHITILSEMRRKTLFFKMHTFFQPTARHETFSVSFFVFFGVRWSVGSALRGIIRPPFQLSPDSKMIKYWSEHEFPSNILFFLDKKI